MAFLNREGDFVRRACHTARAVLRVGGRPQHVAAGDKRIGIKVRTRIPSQGVRLDVLDPHELAVELEQHAFQRSARISDDGQIRRKIQDRARRNRLITFHRLTRVRVDQCEAFNHGVALDAIHQVEVEVAVAVAVDVSAARRLLDAVPIEPAGSAQDLLLQIGANADLKRRSASRQTDERAIIGCAGQTGERAGHSGVVDPIGRTDRGAAFASLWTVCRRVQGAAGEADVHAEPFAAVHSENTRELRGPVAEGREQPVGQVECLAGFTVFDIRNPHGVGRSVATVQSGVRDADLVRILNQLGADLHIVDEEILVAAQVTARHGLRFDPEPNLGCRRNVRADVQGGRSIDEPVEPGQFGPRPGSIRFDLDQHGVFGFDPADVAVVEAQRGCPLNVHRAGDG